MPQHHDNIDVPWSSRLAQGNQVLENVQLRIVLIHFN